MEVSAGDRNPTARWGDLPWETDATWVPNVYLCAYDTSNIDGPFIEIGEERYTVAEARVLLDRLASAIAPSRTCSRWSSPRVWRQVGQGAPTPIEAIASHSAMSLAQRSR